MLLGDLLASARDEKTAIIFEGRHISYRELDDLSNQFAHLFEALGCDHGDRVSMLMGNESLTVGAYFGMFKSGLIANPVNNRLSPEEVEYVLEHAQSRLLIATEEYLPLALGAVGKMALKPAILVLGKCPDTASGITLIRDERLYAQPTSPRVVEGLNKQTVVLLIYTSGTTGRPKGVLLSQGGVWEDALALSQGFRLTPDHVTLCLMPLFHCNALILSHMASFIAHSTVVLCRKFSAREHWNLVAKYGVKSFSAPPTVLAILLEREADTDGLDIQLEFVKTGSAPLTVELAERFERRFGKNILIEGWGLTEATATSTLNPPVVSGRRKPGSVGKAMPGHEVLVVDEQNRILPAGQVGELVIRSNTLMNGYFCDPEATAKAMEGGWLHTGDLGRLDEEGYVYLVGRKKEIIIRGGENISPLEIEEVIARHPAVRDVAVAGLPDRIWGEIVVACVVPAHDVSDDELLRHCRESLADFKIPSRFAFTSELPRNATGKVLRRRVAEYFEEQ
jgi:long-chain acyl-CoA synthetase